MMLGVVLTATTWMAAGLTPNGGAPIVSTRMNIHRSDRLYARNVRMANRRVSIIVALDYVRVRRIAHSKSGTDLAPLTFIWIAPNGRTITHRVKPEFPGVCRWSFQTRRSARSYDSVFVGSMDGGRQVGRWRVQVWMGSALIAADECTVIHARV